MYYIMDEWAVYASGREVASPSPLRVVHTSSLNFSQEVLPCLDATGRVTHLTDEDFLVVIGFPKPPPHGYRWPVPMIEVDGIIPVAPEAASSLAPAKAVLRIEWDESGHVDRADVLYVTKPVQETRWLTDAVVRHVRVRSRSPMSGHRCGPPGDVSRFHRVVTYLILNVRDSLLQLSNRWDIVPMCCCGGECCI